jgi:hypothetical protein
VVIEGFIEQRNRRLELSEEGVSSECSLTRTGLGTPTRKEHQCPQAYLDMLKICDSSIDVPSIILETIHGKWDIEACKRTYSSYK